MLKMRDVHALFSVALAATACQQQTGTNAPSFEESALAEPIVTDFADEVVVPTYAALATRLSTLDESVSALRADRSAESLELARQAWIEARIPWEASEGFLFGPVDSMGFDPALDAWPVNRTDLDAVLAGDDALTAEYVRGLDPSLKGFHTAEYLLFGVDRTKTIDEFTDRELEYLTGVTAEMARIGDALRAAWVEGDSAYATLFRNSGSPDNRTFPSRQSAAEEIVRGAINILDEVANGKIAQPFDEQDQTLVESQFSFNSVSDFANNVRSVRNAWLAINIESGAQGVGIEQYVAEHDPELAAQVTESIETAIEAVEAIPRPFRDAILDPEAADAITTAQERIRDAQLLMQSRVLPLVLR